MRKLVLMLGFLMMTSLCYPRDITVTKVKLEAGKYKDKDNKVYDIVEVPLVSTYAYKKPVVCTGHQ